MIFLDMDGVLCDIVGAVGRLFGRDDLAAEWPAGEYGFAKALGVSEAEIWARVDGEGVGFWAELPAFPWAEQLVEFCRRVADDVRIVTDPTFGIWAHRGKAIWLERHFGGRLARLYHMTPHKHELAQPGRLLIDDHDANVREFRKHHGQAVLVPQRWNALHETAARAEHDKFAYVREEVLRRRICE